MIKTMTMTADEMNKRFIITNMDLLKEYEDKKEKKSLKRLLNRAQLLQGSFNNLLSYEVHVSIIL